MSFQDVVKFAKDYPAILSLVTFFIGLYVGNKQAIGRDRRKEFNDLSEAAFISLNKQIAQLSAGLPGECANDFLLIHNYIPFYKRWLFRRHIERYERAQQNLSTYQVKTGTVTFDREKMTQLSSSAKALLAYLKRR